MTQKTPSFCKLLQVPYENQARKSGMFVIAPGRASVARPDCHMAPLMKLTCWYRARHHDCRPVNVLGM
jgi:hypothetical protein